MHIMQHAVVSSIMAGSSLPVCAPQTPCLEPENIVRPVALLPNGHVKEIPPVEPDANWLRMLRMESEMEVNRAVSIIVQQQKRLEMLEAERHRKWLEVCQRTYSNHAASARSRAPPRSLPATSSLKTSSLSLAPRSRSCV